MECRNLHVCINELEKTKVKPIGCSEDNCLMSCDIRKHLVVEENNKKYRLENPKGNLLASFHVDGGMIRSKKIMKCDHLLLDFNSRKSILVELKGTDLKHAFEQIENTLMRFASVLSRYKVYARIVTSSRTNVPNIKACPQYVSLNKKIAARGGNVKIQSDIMQECVDTM